MDQDEDMVNNSPGSKSNISKLMVDLNKRELEKFFNLDKKTKAAITVSALALLIFVSIGFFSPFRDKLFNQLYQKPPSSASEDLSTWKLYTSNQLNFSFRYPNQFNSETSKDGSVSFSSPDSKLAPNGKLSEGVKLTLSVLTDKNQIDEQINLVETLQNTPKTTYGNEDKALVPDGFNLPANSSFNAVRLYNKDMMLESIVNIFTENAGKKSAIHISCINPGKMGQCESLLPKILSTFKFSN